MKRAAKERESGREGGRVNLGSMTAEQHLQQLVDAAVGALAQTLVEQGSGLCNGLVARHHQIKQQTLHGGS